MNKAVPLREALEMLADAFARIKTLIASLERGDVDHSDASRTFQRIIEQFEADGHQLLLSAKPTEATTARDPTEHDFELVAAGRTAWRERLSVSEMGRHVHDTATELCRRHPELSHANRSIVDSGITFGGTLAEMANDSDSVHDAECIRVDASNDA